VLSAGVPIEANATTCVEPERASCFIVEGHRT
jgi:hypothetical protein